MGGLLNIQTSIIIIMIIIMIMIMMQPTRLPPTA